MDEKLPSSEPFLLSWGIIEQLRDKKYAIPTIDESIVQLQDSIGGTGSDKSGSRHVWPFVKGFSFSRETEAAEPLARNDQPKTDVQVTKF